MKGSGRVPRGVELARIRILRADRDRANKAMIAHAKACYPCRLAVQKAGDYCPEGYELAMAKSRANYWWINRNDYAMGAGEQGTLF